MADSSFFTNKGPLTLWDCAQIAGCALSCDEAKAKSISLIDVAPLQVATDEHVSFFDNAKYKQTFSGTNAGVCVTHPQMAEFAPDDCQLLLSDNPYLAYTKIARAFYPESDRKVLGVSETARIHPDAKIGDNVSIGEYTVIEEGAEIGDNVTIDHHSVIGHCVKVGKGSHIGSHAVVSHCLIGQGCRLHNGVRIGQAGFGFASAMDGTPPLPVPQLGRVIIEDHVNIGASTTIDRGSGPDTVIGAGTIIDNLVQIGHNVKIGKGCVLVSQVGISGSTEIGNFVQIGGQAGLSGHIKIGDFAKIAAQSGVIGDVDAKQEVMGFPARPSREFLKDTAQLKRLSKTKKQK